MVRRLDPYSLQLLVAAAESGSIARAAAKEHLATSAFSRRIGDLEHTFGTALIVRSTRGIELTDAGRLACERARNLNAELETLLQDVRALSGLVSGRVRLFANASSVIGFLPERLKRFGSEHPMVTVELQERLSADVVRACLDDITDLGVCAPEHIPPGLDAWHFARDPLMVVLPTGHPLCRSEQLRFHEVLEYALVGIQHGGALDRQLRDRAGAMGQQLRVAVSVNSFDGVCRMVEAGLGIAVVPRSAAAAYAGADRFVRKPLDEPWIDRELKLVALPKAPRPLAVAALIEALKG